MKKIYWLVLACMMVLVVGCKSTIPVRDYMNEPLVQYGDNAKSTMKSVEKSIVKGAVMLGWNTVVNSDSQITATLNIRKHKLVVDIFYDEKSFSVKYKDSVNLKYNGRKIHRQYANWVTNLIRSIKAQHIGG